MSVEAIKTIGECLLKLKKHEKNSVKQIRNLLSIIEDNGGYIALEYNTASEFYKQELANHYSISCLSSHNSAITIERLLGVEIGSYASHLLPNYGVKLINTAAHNRKKTVYQGISCSLETAGIIKERWVKICEKYKTPNPTPEMLLKELPATREKKNYYEQKAQKATEKLSKTERELQETIEALKKRIKLLQEKGSKTIVKEVSVVPEITREEMARLRLNNENLRNKNAKLERENERLQKELNELKSLMSLSA